MPRFWVHGFTSTLNGSYKELGTIPLYEGNDPRIRYLTIREVSSLPTTDCRVRDPSWFQLEARTRILCGIVNEIAQAFLEFHPDEPVPESNKQVVGRASVCHWRLRA